MSIDPEIDAMQSEWLERYRLTQRWIIVAEPDGYSVHRHTIDGVAPVSTYHTREQAAARLLQCLGIVFPVTPQSWPEVASVGRVSNG